MFYLNGLLKSSITCEVVLQNEDCLTMLGRYCDVITDQLSRTFKTNEAIKRFFSWVLKAEVDTFETS